MAAPKPITLKDRIQNNAAQLLLRGALLIPYKQRISFVGWVMSFVVAPLSGWRRRIRQNLAHVAPDLSPDEVARIQRKVPNNVGRTLIEIYSGEDFLKYVADAPRIGPGVEALSNARDSSKPLVLLTAHIGNYDAVRGTLARDGFPMAALYKPMSNAAFNAHYVEAISKISQPVFPTNGQGIASLAKHLKKGGTIGIVGDVASRKSPILNFFGQPAHTPLTAAEWALKFGADMIPVYGLRQADGFRFEIFVDTPIPLTTPEEMMQAYNDSVERVARDHIDQWFWIHRRWKISKTVR